MVLTALFVSVSDLSFLLKIERVDLLKFSLQPEEEGRLVRLESPLRVGLSCGRDLLRRDHWRRAELLDELQSCQRPGALVQWEDPTFLSAL